MSRYKVRSIKYNILMNIILSSSQIIFPLITLPYVSRVLSTEGIGAVAFAQSVLTNFSLIALLGIQTYGVKACASVRDNFYELSKVVKELLSILLISTTVVFILYLCSIFLVPKFLVNKELFLLFSVGLWLTAFGSEWFYQAIEQYQYITIRNVLFKFFGLLFMFGFVNSKDDYIIYGIIVLFTGYGMNIFNILRLRHLVNFSIVKQINIVIHLRQMFWYSIALICSGMYVQTDVISLGLLGNTHMVGLYQLVVKIKSVLIQIVNSVGNVLLPRMSYYKSNNDTKSIVELVSKNYNFIGIVSGMIIGCTILCSDAIVLVLGGTAYVSSSIPLIIIIPAVLFSSLNILLANILITESKERDWAIANVVGFIASVAYSIVCISLWGVKGAALSCVLTEVTEFIVRAVKSGSLFLKTIFRTDLLKIFIINLFAFFITYIFKHAIEIPSPLCSICFFCGIYILLDLLIMLFFKESFVNEIFRQLLCKIDFLKTER